MKRLVLLSFIIASLGASAQYSDRVTISNPRDVNSEDGALVIGFGANSRLLLDNNEIQAFGDNLYVNHNNPVHLILNNGGGNVGIGTSNPDNPLTLIRDKGVAAGVHPLARFSRLEGGLGNAGMSISYEANGTEASRTLLYFPGGLGATFTLYNQGVMDVLHLNPDGNVGIGTQNPDSRLTVNGSTRLYSTSDALLRLQADTDNVNEGDNARIEILQDGGATGAYLGFNLDWGGTSEPDNVFRIVTRYNNVDFPDRFTMNTANGNIGIGTNIPSENLHIDSDAPTHLLISGKQAKSYFRINDEDVLLLTGSYTNGLASQYTFLQSPLAGSTVINSSGSDTKRLLIGSRTNIPVVLGTNDIERVRIDENGNVGIGTDQPDAKLTVKGDIHTQEVTIDLLGAIAPDFVFEEDYDLRSLEETEAYIDTHKHLPEIPSAQEMAKNGMELKAMNLKLLQKVEELTLYLIEQDKEIKEQRKLIEALQEQQKP